MIRVAIVDDDLEFCQKIQEYVEQYEFESREKITLSTFGDGDEIVNKYEPALIRVDKAEPIEIILNPGQVFRSGDTSPYIYLLQAMLAQLSNNNPTIMCPSTSGVMDKATTDALAAYQTLANLPPTGEFDKVTWKHLVKHFTANANHITNTG